MARLRTLGLDIGSLYLGCVILEDGRVARTRYLEHRGDWAAALAGVLETDDFRGWDRAGVTASSRLSVEGCLDATLAVVEGSRLLVPGCRNVISVGAETYLLAFFDSGGHYVEHSVNPPCAAGTGSFLEQQAERLGLGVTGLAEKAAAWEGKTPRIATRCAVFAKTDMIHAQQEGYGREAICAGLCEGIARSLAASLVKGRALLPPVALVGGVALNRKVARSLEEALGTPVVVPDHAEVAGAVGAAVLGGMESLDALLHATRGHERSGRTRPALSPRAAASPEHREHRELEVGDVEVLLPAAGTSGAGSPSGAAFAGIDIGSTSTKAVLLGGSGDLVAGFYTATRGDPMDAVRRLAGAAASLLGEPLPLLRSACTTGSGRKMVRALFLADMDVDEISAHARAAVELHPGVDTIIEIGGQDSKFTRLEEGRVTQAVMNYVCAAGTGSFIEEQARRLGIPLARFADEALGAEAPYTSDRCTVYMERDLNTLLAEGWSRQAVAAAVLHSVRDNYLAKVVGRSALGEHVVFQGATARNRALVAAFEQHLGRPITVSPLCHLAGALGAALLARDQAAEGSRSTSRFAWGADDLSVERERCILCVNHCELTVVQRDGVRAGWGMKCGREYAERGARRLEPSAPERRSREHFGPLLDSRGDGSRGRAGVATALYHAGYAPLWSAFLTGLGFDVTLARRNDTTLTAGRSVVNSDFCAPMIVAHGQLLELADPGLPLIFCPALERDGPSGGQRETFRTKTTDDYYCYYSQYFSSIASNLTALDLRDRLVAPLLDLEDEGGTVSELHRELARVRPDITEEEVSVAWRAAVRRHREAESAWARTIAANEILGDRSGGMRVILLGRPYVLLDPTLHLGIPRKIEEHGVEVFWQDEIDTTGFEPRYAGRYLERMHWRYGKKILSVAELAAQSESAFVVAVSCFRCSPDSFLLSYVKEIMEHYRRPHLALQLDELASDVGYATRIEAALRSFREARRVARRVTPPPAPRRARNDPLAGRRTVLVPHIDELISELWAASLRAGGHEALVLTPDERSLASGYRYCNGGECMPLVSILGSAIDAIRDRDLDPAETFCYLPTICMGCNFPQFPVLAAHVFEAAGLGGVGIGLINMMALGDTLPTSTALRMLESQIVGSLLHKLYHRIRPYERVPGATDAVLRRARAAAIEAIRTGGDLQKELARAVEAFAAVERDESGGRKPRIALLGDVYVKYSSVVNQHLQDVVFSLGGELVIPSLTEYAFHFFDADARLLGGDPRHGKLLRRVESRFERIAAPLIGDLVEPDVAECVAAMEEYGIRHYLAGETSINVGRALHMIRKGQVDAIIHANPMFCCPGVVTASIFRKIQADFGVPIVDIFYDGSADPNRVLIPHLHYLDRIRRAARGEPAAAAGL